MKVKTNVRMVMLRDAMTHVGLLAGMVPHSILPQPIAVPADDAIEHRIRCHLLHDSRENTVLRRNVLEFDV
jgi:hypothetical protein